MRPPWIISRQLRMEDFLPKSKFFWRAETFLRVYFLTITVKIVVWNLPFRYDVVVTPMWLNEKIIKIFSGISNLLLVTFFYRNGICLTISEAADVKEAAAYNKLRVCTFQDFAAEIIIHARVLSNAFTLSTKPGILTAYLRFVLACAYNFIAWGMRW